MACLLIPGVGLDLQVEHCECADEKGECERVSAFVVLSMRGDHTGSNSRE